MPPKRTSAPSAEPASKRAKAASAKSKPSRPAAAPPPPAAAPPIPEKTVLVALVGMSPAVLTETVYALATQSPAVVPERIVVLTTTGGRDAVVRTLLTPPKPGSNTPWGHFAMEMVRRGLDPDGRLRFGEADIHCIPSAKRDYLGDVASREDNALLADFLLDELRRHTENPSTRVVASIAGGRKTMSALLLSCMTLLARRQDSACHVLVSPPYDNPRLSPPFLFPEERLSHTLDGKKHPSSKARIDLIDVPFVKIRGWYANRHRNSPPGYSDLVAHAQSFFPPPTNEALPFLEFDLREGKLSADGVPVPLSPSHLLALALFLRQKDLPGHPGKIMWALHENKAAGELDRIPWLADFRSTGRFADLELAASEDFRKVFSDLRKVLRNFPKTAAFADTLAPRLSSERPTAVWPGDRMSADIPFLLRLLPKG